MAFNTSMIASLAAPVNLANEAGTAFNDVRNAARADQLGRLSIQHQAGANQMQGLDIAAEQRKQAATAAHQQAIQSALTKDQNGIPVLDPQGYVSQMAQRGFGDVAMENVPKIQQALEHVRQTAEAGIQREMRDQANPALMPGGRLALGASQATAEQVGAANKATVAQMAPLLDQQASHLMAAYNNLEAPTYEQAKAVVEDAKAQLGGAPDHDHLDALVADPNAFDPDTFRAQIKMIADKSLAAGTQFKNELESGKLTIKQQEADVKGQRADAYVKHVEDQGKYYGSQVERWNKDREAKLQIARMTEARIREGKTVTVADAGNLARMIAEYRLKPTARQMTPQIAQMVAAINPDYDENKYNEISGMRKEFVSGKARQSITALSTALPHMAQMMEAFDEMGNTQFPSVNRLKNFFSGQSGEQSIAKYNAAVEPVAEELARLYKGGTPTKGERDGWIEKFSPNMSKEQAKAVIQQAVEQAASRLKALDDQWETSMPGVQSPAKVSAYALEKARSVIGPMADDILATPSPNADVQQQSNAKSFIHPKPSAPASASAKQARRTATMADF